MDPVTLILGALAAGASAGVADTTAQAVKDGYSNLKALLARRFAGNAKAAEALVDYEGDPETYEKPLGKQIEAAGADHDEEVLAAAKALLLHADQAGIHTKYNITVTGGKVGNIGDHGTVTMQ